MCDRGCVQNQIPPSAVKSWAEDVIPSTPILFQTITSSPPTAATPCTQDKRLKTQKKIEFCLEYVVSNLETLLALFKNPQIS